MKNAWKKFAALIDERNTRERVLLFATAIIVTALLLDTLLAAPVAVQSKRIMQETATDQAEMVKLAAQVQTRIREKGADPDVSLKARLAELQTRQAAMQREIEAQSAELVAPDQITAMLEKILVL